MKAFSNNPEYREFELKHGTFPAYDEKGMIQYAGIKFRAQLDIADYPIQVVNSDNILIGESVGSKRRINFQWEIKDGDLKIASTATDLEKEISWSIPPETSTKYALQIVLPPESILPDKLSFIFDTRPSRKDQVPLR